MRDDTHRSARGTKSDTPRLPLPLLLLLHCCSLYWPETVWRTHAGKAIVIGDRSIDKGARPRQGPSRACASRKAQEEEMKDASQREEGQEGESERAEVISTRQKETSQLSFHGIITPPIV